MRCKPPFVALLVALAAVAAVTAAASAPRATMIGDSVATEITLDSRARAILGPRVRLELAPCRRLAQPSCRADAPPPPSALEVIRHEGSALGSVVVISVGYNDPEKLYAGNIESTLLALRRAHVRRVLWLTLRATRHPYLTMNADIREAATHHPELRVVDWNRYSRSHPAWFQRDGLHLSIAGASAMATLVHRALLRFG
jgi:hypothetical protein